MRKLDLKGQRFGRLTVIRELTERKNGEVYWLCKCDCSNITEVRGHNLASGASKSCGCLHAAIIRKMLLKHGHAAKGMESRTYQSWRNLLKRCNNPKNLYYKNYGGRGITVCKRWSKFENFLADMGECPEGLTLDRKNNDGNYEPGNCRWATRFEQMQNNSTNKLNPLKVEVIKKLLQESQLKQYEIGEIFNVGRRIIYKIKAGRNWNNINYTRSLE